MENDDIMDMNRVMRFIHHHGLWQGAAWGIAAVALIDGSSYSVKGNKLATGPSYSVLRDQVPGGMKIYGYAMLLIAAFIIYATASHSATFCRRVMLGVFIFSVWMNVLTFAGWIHAGQVGIGGLSKWFLILWLSLWLAATAGPYHGGGDAT